MDWLYHPFRPQSPMAKKLSDPSSFTGCLILFSSALIGTKYMQNVTNIRGRNICLILLSKQSMLDLGLHAYIFLQIRYFVKEINQADEIEYMRVNEGTGFSESS